MDRYSDRAQLITDRDQLESLRSRLVPAGIPLRDVRPDQRGLRWNEYLSVHWDEMREAARKARESAPPPPYIPIATPRDRYGWRSLPPGTRLLPS